MEIIKWWPASQFAAACCCFCLPRDWSHTVRISVFEDAQSWLGMILNLATSGPHLKLKSHEIIPPLNPGTFTAASLRVDSLCDGACSFANSCRGVRACCQLSFLWRPRIEKPWAKLTGGKEGVQDPTGEALWDPDNLLLDATRDVARDAGIQNDGRGEVSSRIQQVDCWSSASVTCLSFEVQISLVLVKHIMPRC
eukprot:s636_g22.t1